MGRGTPGRICLVSLHGLTAVIQTNRQIENKRQREKDISRGAKEISLLPFPAFIMPVHWRRLPCLAPHAWSQKVRGRRASETPLCVRGRQIAIKSVCVFVESALLNNYGCLNAAPLP